MVRAHFIRFAWFGLSNGCQLVVLSATDTTIIPACPQPTGVMVVGMDMDVPAFPMVIHTRENTSVINDMDGVFTSGMMDESTMDCLVKTRDTEGCVLLAS